MGTLARGSKTVVSETAKIAIVTALAFVVLNIVARTAFQTRGMSVFVGAIVIIYLLKML